MTNRRQVLLNNRGEVTLLSLARQKPPAFLARRARYFSTYYPFLLNKLLLRLFEGTLFTTVLFISVCREVHKGVYIVEIFGSFRWHVFVVLSRDEKVRERDDRNNRCTRMSTMTRTASFFFRNCNEKSEAPAARPCVFIRDAVQTSAGVNSPGRGSLCPPTRVIAPSGEGTRDCNSPWVSEGRDCRLENHPRSSISL